VIFDPVLDIFRGKAITIPPLDGAFRPNTRLDDAPVLAALSAPDNLAVLSGGLAASRGASLVAISGRSEPEWLETFSSPVTAIAVSHEGEIAVGLESGDLMIGGVEASLPAEIGCITALAYGAGGTLWLANGSANHPPSGWVTDLMELGRSGSVWRRGAGETGFRAVARGLGFPYGLHPEAEGVIVSESWRHRLVRITPEGRATTVLGHLPGYPARLSPASGGGAWLSIFAPRNRLIEFVLEETRYREDMLAEVPREFWIAPALSSGRSFLEPLQCGGIKTMGIHKPWAPSRSCGLVVRLDAQMRPLFSLHSRSNGKRHGTVSALEHQGQLIVASKGGDCVMAIDLPSEGH